MIYTSGKQFRTLDDELLVNGKKVYWATANGKVVYPERDNRPYVFRVSGEIDLSWTHQCRYYSTAPYVTYQHRMVGKAVCAIRSRNPIRNQGSFTVDRGTQPSSYYGGDWTHASSDRPTIETILFDTYNTDLVAEIACYGQLVFEFHNTSYPYNASFAITPETQSTFESTNAKEWERIVNGYNAEVGLRTAMSSYVSDNLRNIIGVGVTSKALPYKRMQSGVDPFDITLSTDIAFIPFSRVDYSNYDMTVSNPTITETAPLEMMHVSIEDL